MKTWKLWRNENRRSGGLGRPMGLILTAFISGAALMSLELVGSRQLAPRFGSGVLVWGSLLAVVLAALSLGSLLGGWLADRSSSSRLLALVLLFASATVGLPELVRAEIIDFIVGLEVGQQWGALLAAMALLGPGSLALGAITPTAVKLYAARSQRVGVAAGAISGASSVGGIFGALGTAFVLIPRNDIAEILLGLGLLLGASALGVAASARVAGPGLGAAAVMIVLMVGHSQRAPSLADAPPALPEMTRWAPQDFPGVPTWSGRSTYHDIQVWDLPAPDADVTTQRWMLINGVPQNVVSVNHDVVDHSRTPEHARMERGLDLIFAMRPLTRRVLFIGLGGGSMPSRLAALHEDLEIAVVELDPTVVEIAERWFALDRERIAVHTGDGRAWLASSGERWDAIVLDAYHGATIPFHLTTAEFMALVRARLSPGGLVVANLVGAIEGERADLVRATVKTWQSALGATAIYPISTVEEDYSVVPADSSAQTRRETRHILVLGSPEPLPDTPLVIERVEQMIPLGRADQGSVEVARTRWEGDLDLKGAVLLRDEYAPTNLLHRR